MVNTEIATAIINNAASILTAIGMLATAFLGIWTAVRQSQTHTTVTNLKAKYDADHPEGSV